MSDRYITALLDSEYWVLEQNRGGEYTRFNRATDHDDAERQARVLNLKEVEVA